MSEENQAPPSGEQRSENSTGASAGETEAREEREYDGRKGPEPTRYGDWEMNGRCIDF